MDAPPPFNHSCLHLQNLVSASLTILAFAYRTEFLLWLTLPCTMAIWVMGAGPLHIHITYYTWDNAINDGYKIFNKLKQF